MHETASSGGSTERWFIPSRDCSARANDHAAAMIVVHHLNNSRSQRVLWLLEELGIPYEVKRYQRDAKTMLAPPELAQVHPLGKSPVVVDGDATVAESGAIIEYLATKYGQDGAKLVPPAGSPERLRYTYWLHYAEGSAMPPLLLKLIFSKIKSNPAPFFVKPIIGKIVAQVSERLITPQLTRHAAFIEAELRRSTFFAGEELTGADIQMSFPVEAMVARGGAPKDTHPKMHAFLARIHERPAFQRALERGGPFEIL